MNKSRISKNWIRKQHKDVFVRKSKVFGYRSRAIYKIEEINNKFRIFNNNSFVVDLGAAPGSWSQYLKKIITKGKILSIDLKEIEKIDGVHFLQGDFTDIKNQEKIREYFGKKLDVVISDMAVNTTGNKELDSMLTGELCIEAMNFAKKLLKPNGFFISKFFMGSISKEIITIAKKNFQVINIFKPKASRSDSKENFIIGKFLKKYDK